MTRYQEAAIYRLREEHAAKQGANDHYYIWGNRRTSTTSTSVCDACD